MNTSVKSSQNIAFLGKQNIIAKHNKLIRMSFIDLTPYLNSQFGFIDPDFPHTGSSINLNEQLEHEDMIDWVPAEHIHEYSNYSDLITNLQTELFSKKSIGHALTIINWFANVYFGDIFIKDLSSFHLYTYDIMIDGTFVNVPIDSYIPVNSKTKQELFSKNYKGSIFPCLYQKLLAKIYGDYESVTADFMDIVELQTMFCREEISLTLGIEQQFLIQTIKNSIQDRSIVSFKTRNSIRLQSFGLESNSIFIILRIIPKDNTYLLQFLQLQGQKWIGKFSKLRTEWIFDKQFIEQNKIVQSQEYKENYILLSDMKGIARELTILHNTLDYHKNYYGCNSNQYNFSGYQISLKEQVNKVMIRVNYKHKKCYNSVFIIDRNKNTNGKDNFDLICSTFNEYKDNNYIELQMQKGQYTIIVYNTHPQQDMLPYNITIFSTNQFIQLSPIKSISEVLNTLESTFKNYFIKEYSNSKQQVICKQLYNDTGLSFIFVNKPIKRINLDIDSGLMRDHRIYLIDKSLNSKKDKEKQKEDEIYSIKIQVQKDQSYLMMFRCAWSKKQNINFDYEQISSKENIQKIIFPPLNSIRITQKKKND